MLNNNPSGFLIVNALLVHFECYYRVFTYNCGKVAHSISGSITHIFLKFLYLDYNSRTYITTNFQYHSRSFDIRNAS